MSLRDDLNKKQELRQLQLMERNLTEQLNELDGKWMKQNKIVVDLVSQLTGLMKEQQEWMKVMLQRIEKVENDKDEKKNLENKRENKKSKNELENNEMQQEDVIYNNKEENFEQKKEDELIENGLQMISAEDKIILKNGVPYKIVFDEGREIFKEISWEQIPPYRLAELV